MDGEVAAVNANRDLTQQAKARKAGEIRAAARADAVQALTKVIESIEGGVKHAEGKLFDPRCRSTGPRARRRSART